jgi:hypothetical protein
MAIGAGDGGFFARRSESALTFGALDEKFFARSTK